MGSTQQWAGVVAVPLEDALARRVEAGAGASAGSSGRRSRGGAASACSIPKLSSRPLSVPHSRSEAGHAYHLPVAPPTTPSSRTCLLNEAMAEEPQVQLAGVVAVALEDASACCAEAGEDASAGSPGRRCRGTRSRPPLPGPSSPVPSPQAASSGRRPWRSRSEGRLFQVRGAASLPKIMSTLLAAPRLPQPSPPLSDTGSAYDFQSAAASCVGPLLQLAAPQMPACAESNFDGSVHSEAQPLSALLQFDAMLAQLGEHESLMQGATALQLGSSEVVLCRPTVALAELWSPEQVVAAEPLDAAEAPVLPLSGAAADAPDLPPAQALTAELEFAALLSELAPVEASPRRPLVELAELCSPALRPQPTPSAKARSASSPRPPAPSPQLPELELSLPEPKVADVASLPPISPRRPPQPSPSASYGGSARDVPPHGASRADFVQQVAVPEPPACSEVHSDGISVALETQRLSTLMQLDCMLPKLGERESSM